MSRLNKNLVKAGVIALVNEKSDDFIDRLSKYLCEKPELVDYLFDGPIPLDDEIKKKIELYIKHDIPVEEDFVGIEEISTGFNWSSEQIYNVKYRANRYFTINNEPYSGLAVRDEEHPVCYERVLEKQIDPNQLK